MRSKSGTSLTLDFITASLFTRTPAITCRMIEFFTTHINNDQTRRIYCNVVRTFSMWCEKKGIHTLGQVEPNHLVDYLEELGQYHSASTVKQHLSSLRMLFEW